jgi:hypothetical protein
VTLVVVGVPERRTQQDLELEIVLLEPRAFALRRDDSLDAVDVDALAPGEITPNSRVLRVSLRAERRERADAEREHAELHASLHGDARPGQSVAGLPRCAGVCPHAAPPRRRVQRGPGDML